MVQALLPRETKVVDWFRGRGDWSLLVRIVGKDRRLGSTYVQKLAVDRSNGDRSGFGGSSKVTAGVSRNSRGFSQRDKRPRSSSLTALEARAGIGEKRAEPRLTGNPQQRDRIKMCAEDVYVRRRGTARRATREFQPPLRGRLRRPYTRSSRETDTLHPALFTGYFCNGSHTQSATRSIYAVFHCLGASRNAHGCRVNSCLEVRELRSSSPPIN